MNAEDIKRALVTKWPDDRYCHVYEAPTQSDRGGNKIDVLVLALWWSDKHEIDAIEIKVSVSDWKREIQTSEWINIDSFGHPRAFPSKIQAEAASMRHGGSVISANRLDTSKSQLWRERSHRFWIACPVAISGKIMEDLPDGWGLLSVDDEGLVTVECRAKRNTDVQPLTWPQSVGVIRAAADSGLLALRRAYAKGFTEGLATDATRSP